MNKVFRLIWSIAKQAWVVAAEKVSSKGGIPARTVCALCAVTLLTAGGAAYALPNGNTLVAGQATVTTPAAGQMQITQSTNNAIINWNSFGIAAGEAVNISQPSSQAALLNRVVGNSGSEIFGKLSANGQVFLINPNGVLFGRGAEVNVGGLVASSLNMTDDNFMNSNLKFFKDGAAGSVVNQGSITAGFAALLGPTVDNSGTIITFKGSTVLGAADAVTLDFDAQGLIALKLDQGAYGAQVQNSGVIEADGGRVLLTAKSADDILKSMVNTSGRIQARSVENRNGEILLLGDMQNGTVKVDGLLDASAPNGGNGGFIETSAATVQVADSARVTTLAPQGNVGTWLIDPDGFTIAADGDMTGAAVGTALAGGNFSIASTGGSGSDGNINVNDTVSWSANKLALTATNDINVNAVMTANGTASLDLEPGSGKVNMGLSGSGFYGRVDFAGRSGLGFLTIGGNGYTVIGDNVTDLQGIGSGNYALGSNIDATATSSWNSGAGFAPIMSYAGNFNGLGHTINGLTINRPMQQWVGLFGAAAAAAISNVGLVDGSVSGSSQVGALVGLVSDSSIITNSYATGAVSGQWLYIGGLVGENNGSTISACFSTGSVSDATFYENSTQSIGGLVGLNSGSSIITNSYATGMVSG
jgi:filamentous hemagglutinin family protein